MKTLLFAVAATIALAGCQGPEPRAPETAAAERFVADGRFEAAAEEYLALSQTVRGPAAHGLLLKAVALLVDVGQRDRASGLLDELAGQAISDELAPQYALLAADLALRRGEPQRTLERLSDVPASLVGHESAPKLHLLRARAYEDTGRFLDAARERAMLDEMLDDATRRAANHSALWDALTRARRARREQALPAATGAFLGWLRLATAVEEHRSSPDALVRALSRWQAEFPSHPAGEEIVTMMLGAVSKTVRQPTRIALLLPLHGDFAEAARVVRDGFLAAWYSDASSTLRPSVEVHDTSFEAIGVVYARAVEVGADFVVGPLRRGPVTSLACGDTPLVTTLALNEIAETPASGDRTSPGCGPQRPMPGLYHFALTPEAEVRQVAERAWFDGFGKAVAFTREGKWGERIHRAFAAELERLGGILLDHRVLPSVAGEVGKPVAAALGVSQSRERAREIRRILKRKVEHEPRRRQDVDFVFMAARPAGARQLKPHLAFHHAPDLPVYSTSYAWSGVHDPTGDRDLDGVVLGDMPWLVTPEAPEQASLRGQLGDALATQSPELSRLYAFGADAYRLAIGLRRITGDPLSNIDGHTGRLSAGPDHRIVRRLSWVRFADGLPTPYDPDAAER